MGSLKTSINVIAQICCVCLCLLCSAMLYTWGRIWVYSYLRQILSQNSECRNKIFGIQKCFQKFGFVVSTSSNNAQMLSLFVVSGNGWAWTVWIIYSKLLFWANNYLILSGNKLNKNNNKRTNSASAHQQCTITYFV